MTDFAKLFSVAGTQMLVTIQENDEGFPEVRYRSNVNGLTVEMAPSFDGDDGWDRAERLFESIQQADAEFMHQHMAEMMGEFAYD